MRAKETKNRDTIPYMVEIGLMKEGMSIQPKAKERYGDEGEGRHQDKDQLSFVRNKFFDGIFQECQQRRIITERLVRSQVKIEWQRVNDGINLHVDCQPV